MFFSPEKFIAAPTKSANIREKKDHPETQKNGEISEIQKTRELNKAIDALTNLKP